MEVKRGEVHLGAIPPFREKFDTYRFADHKEKVIDLLMRVTRVSVETQEIVGQMRDQAR